MYNRTLLIGRIGHNAEAKTDKNQQEYVVLSIATKDSWKNDQGDYESRTEWHRVYAWRNLSRFAKTLQKGQLISVDGQIRYREYAEEVNGTTVKHRVAEIHAYKLQRLSKVEGQGDPPRINPRMTSDPDWRRRPAGSPCFAFFLLICVLIGRSLIHC